MSQQDPQLLVSVIIPTRNRAKLLAEVVESLFVQTLDPSRYEVLYWSDGGLRRLLRSVADPYTYWLATTDARERTLKQQMKQLHGDNVRQAVEELVRLTGHCRNTEERLAILEPYFQKPQMSADERESNPDYSRTP